MSQPLCHAFYASYNSLQVIIKKSHAHIHPKNKSIDIIKKYTGDIMVGLGQPSELAPLINTYSRILIPYIFFTAYAAVFMRLLQALDLQIGLTYCCVISLASAPFFVWLFMYPLQMGYLGAAMGQNLVLVMFCLTQFTYLAYKGIYNLTMYYVFYK